MLEGGTALSKDFISFELSFESNCEIWISENFYANSLPQGIVDYIPEIIHQKFLRSWRELNRMTFNFLANAFLLEYAFRLSILNSINDLTGTWYLSFSEYPIVYNPWAFQFTLPMFQVIFDLSCVLRKKSFNFARTIELTVYHKPFINDNALMMSLFFHKGIALEDVINEDAFILDLFPVKVLTKTMFFVVLNEAKVLLCLAYRHQSKDSLYPLSEITNDLHTLWFENSESIRFLFSIRTFRTLCHVPTKLLVITVSLIHISLSV